MVPVPPPYPWILSVNPAAWPANAVTQAVLTDGTHYLIYISTPLLHAYWLVPYKAILEPK